MSTGHALRERAQLLDELGQIMQAMKNLAFAELQRLQRAEPALQTARETVVSALEALQAEDGEAPAHRSETDLDAARPATWPRGRGGGRWGGLVIGAERGFCGSFNARLVDAMRLGPPPGCPPPMRWWVASGRLRELLHDHGQESQPLPGCGAVDELGASLDAWVAEMGAAQATGWNIVLLHVGAGQPAWECLPSPEAADGAEFQERASERQAQGWRLLAPRGPLRSALARQAMRVQLQAALQSSLGEENRWRLAQMQRAQDHLDELSGQLRRRWAALRQADITNELETLMSALSGSAAT